MKIEAGQRYTKDGVSVDVTLVKDGEVYARRWPKGVLSQSFFHNCIRVPLNVFVANVKDFTSETL